MEGRRLLIVDDDPRISRLVKNVGEELGYVVHAVNDPQDFLITYRQVTPHLVVLDLHMKQLDGIELLRQLTDESHQTAVLLVSGVDPRILNTAERLGKSLGLDMRGAIHKPLSLDLLRNSLRQQRALSPTKHRAAIPTASRAELIEALAQGDFCPFYQPKVDLHHGVVVGAEALARWRRPSGEILLPRSFIPSAESSRLIEPLTFAILQGVLQDMASWPECASHLHIAVNLSAQLLNDVTLPDRIEALVDHYGIAPSRLTLEVTESWAVGLSPRSMDILTRLRLKGLQLAIDDLGTGYASLENLYALPYGELKIDRYYVASARTQADAQAVVRSIAGLGTELGVTVVAEGIEDPAARQWLQAIGCHVGQGFLFSQALENGGFLRWLERFQDHRF